MNDNVNQYILLWQKYIFEMKEALDSKDFRRFEELELLAKDAYQKYKEDTKMTYECKNFGMVKAIFESRLTDLFKTNKKIVKEYIKTIKEDKNLLGQFHFYKALEDYNANDNTIDYVNESLSLASKMIDYKTIDESNQKLIDIINKYQIKPSAKISDDDLSLFENCHTILSKKKKLTNLMEITNKIKSISEYVDTHKKEVISESKQDVYVMIEDFDKKYATMLNEEEKTFVQELIDFKSKGVGERKEKLFNKLKNECVDIVNKLINESDNDVKENLLNVKEQLLNKEYFQETLIKDVAKLLEIREILLKND